MSQEQGTTVLVGSKMLQSDTIWEQTQEASRPEYTGLQAATQLCSHGELSQSRRPGVTLMLMSGDSGTAKPPTSSQGGQALVSQSCPGYLLQTQQLCSVRADPHRACGMAR